MGHFNEYHYDVEKMVTYFADILVTQILSVEVVAKWNQYPIFVFDD